MGSTADVPATDIRRCVHAPFQRRQVAVKAMSVFSACETKTRRGLNNVARMD